VERHASVHLVQDPAFRSIFTFGLFEDQIGPFGVPDAKTLIHKEIAVRGGAASFHRDQDRRGNQQGGRHNGETERDHHV
jgi:hypothetical protein